VWQNHGGTLAIGGDCSQFNCINSPMRRFTGVPKRLPLVFVVPNGTFSLTACRGAVNRKQGPTPRNPLSAETGRFETRVVESGQIALNKTTGWGACERRQYATRLFQFFAFHPDYAICTRKCCVPTGLPYEVFLRR